MKMVWCDLNLLEELVVIKKPEAISFWFLYNL